MYDAAPLTPEPHGPFSHSPVSAQPRERLLLGAAQLLGSSLEFEENLLRLAPQIAQLGDFCLIDLIDEDGEIARLTAVSREPKDAELAERLGSIHLRRDCAHFSFEPLVLGRPSFRESLDREQLASLVQDPDHQALVTALQLRALISVPIVADRVAGAITVLGCEPTTRLGEDELGLLKELARLAGAAVSNARRFRAERRAREAREEMLAQVAHDLANPLSTIQIAAQTGLLQASAHAPEVVRHIELVRGAAKRTLRLVQDLLDFSRLELGGLKVMPALFPLGPLVEDAVAQARPLANGVELIAEPGVLPPVYADRDRVFQVLANLLGNALKFTRPGGTVRLTAAVREDEVELVVSDTGIGIPQHCLPMVFERFWQATQADRRGAGLGLSIAKSLVEAQGGRLWAKSAVGKGSTFGFTLPRAAA